MKCILQPISEEMFKERVEVRFESINDGFKRFKNFTLQSNSQEDFEEKMIMFINKVFKLNGEDNSYVDFYLSKLDEDSKSNLFNLLNAEDKEMLRIHMGEVKDETIYFRLSKEAIPFITRLSTREVLFCTFYFTKFPCTIWGNYNMKFPIFFKDKDTVRKYGGIALECRIEINKDTIL